MSKQRKKKKIINKRKVVALVAVQLFIILCFTCMLQGSLPISPERTKSATIIVEDIIFIGGREGKLIISSDSGTYVFDNSGYPEQYSVHKVENMIAVGDTITILYTKSWMLSLGTHNRIVDARKGEETLRSMDVYNESIKNHSIYTSIFWGFIELVFLLVVIAMICSKSFYRN